MRFIHPIMTIGILVGYPAARASATSSGTCPVFEDALDVFDGLEFVDITSDNIESAAVNHSEGLYEITCDQRVTTSNNPLYSAVFSVKDATHAKLLIKYAISCDPWTGDMLTKNYEMIKIIKQIESKSGLKLTPDVVKLSTAYPLVNLGAGRSFRTITVAVECINNLGEGRFMIMKRAGPNLKQIFDSRITFARVADENRLRIETLHVGMKVFRKLAILHDNGIVHGDITWENVLLAEDSGTTNPNLSDSDFVFVDWDKSFVAQCGDFFQIGQFDSDTHKIMPNEPETGSVEIDVQRVFKILEQMLPPPGSGVSVTPRWDELNSLGNAGAVTKFKGSVEKIKSAREAENAIRSLVDAIAASVIQ